MCKIFYFCRFRNRQQPGAGEWKHGLFECHCPDCAIAYIIPCIYACQVAGAAGKDGCGKCIYCLFPG